MREVFLQVIQASLAGSAVIGIVLALRLLLRRAPKSAICLLWLLAGLRLLCPWSIESSFSLQPDYSAALPVTQIQAGNGEPVSGEAAPLPAPDDVHTQVSGPQSAGTGTIVNSVPETAPAIADYCAWVWLVGMGLLVLYYIVSYVNLKLRVRFAVQTPDGYLECSEIGTPFLLGIIKPRIYLPTGLTAADQELILLHEQAHLARRDHLWKLVGLAVLALHWFNPLVWLAYCLLCRDIEMACDERVVKSMDTAGRKAYSTALLSCNTNRRTPGAVSLSFGEDSPKQRIHHVLNYRRPSFWIIVVCVVVLAFVAVCFLTDPFSPDSGEPSATTASTEPAEQTQPTEPPATTTPTEPPEQTQPTEPPATTVPTEPAEQTQPTEPPATTVPTEPAEQTQPTEPPATTVPTEPAEQIQPTEPPAEPLPTEHVHSYRTGTREPTCTTGGYDYHVCECGDDYVDNYTSPQHKYKITNSVAPSQFMIGWEFRRCELCDATRKDYLGNTGYYDLEAIEAWGKAYAESLGFTVIESNERPNANKYTGYADYDIVEREGGQEALYKYMKRYIDYAYYQAANSPAGPEAYVLWLGASIASSGSLGISRFIFGVYIR